MPFDVEHPFGVDENQARDIAKAKARAATQAQFKADADAAARVLETAPPAHKDERPPPPARPGLVWQEAIGIPPCVRGGTVAACEKVFGRGKRDKDYPDHVSWPDTGIEISTANTRVGSVWAHFQNDGFAPFAGTGDHWLDATATLDDVLRWFGPAEKAYDYPDAAGVRQTSLLYFKRGLYFDFNAGVIRQIAIVPPSEAPEP